MTGSPDDLRFRPGPRTWMVACWVFASSMVSMAPACTTPLDSLFSAKAYAAVVECASDTGQILSASDQYRVLLSHLYQNRLGRARAYGDSILPLIPLGAAPRDSILATTRYLHDLLENRTGPPVPISPWKWTAQTGLSHEIGAFQWMPGPAEWGQTLATQYQRSAGLLQDPDLGPAGRLASETRQTDLGLSASISFTGNTLRHRLSGSGRLGLSHTEKPARLGISQAQLRYAIQRGAWEISTTPAAQWDGTERYSSSWTGQVKWTRQRERHSWNLAVHGTTSAYPTLGLEFKQADCEAAYTRASRTWLARSSMSFGALGRSGASVRETPVRIASCRDIQDGQAASERPLVCYDDPSSEVVAPLHPFKGISGYPFRSADPLWNRSWSSLVRMGASQFVHRELSKGRWNLSGSVSYLLERSLEPVEWNNGFLGNTLGDSLFAFHDRASDRDYLWERDIRGRFLELARRKEIYQLHSGSLHARLGWRPFPKSEIFVAGSYSRAWTDLPSESGESGYGRWSSELGWSQNL